MKTRTKVLIALGIIAAVVIIVVIVRRKKLKVTESLTVGTTTTEDEPGLVDSIIDIDTSAVEENNQSFTQQRS